MVELCNTIDREIMKILSFLFLISLLTSCGTKEHKKIVFEDKDTKVQAHKNHSDLNQKFLSKDLNIKDWEKDFEDHKRDVIINRKKIISKLSLTKGMKVADVGAGTGSFLKSLLIEVGDTGSVYAVEISPVFLKHLEEKKLNNKWNNLFIVKGEFEKTNLEKDFLDVVFLVDTYHHFDNPASMLNDFTKILKTNGKLVVVDFNKTAKSREWVKNHVKLSKKDYISEIEKAGFQFLKDEKISFKENFMLTFVKK